MKVSLAPLAIYFAVTAITLFIYFTSEESMKYTESQSIF